MRTVDQMSIDCIKIFRKKHELSRRQCADLLGYNIVTFQQYENGIRAVPNHLLNSMDTYNKYAELRPIEK